MSRIALFSLVVLVCADAGCSDPDLRFRKLSDINRVLVTGEFGYDTVLIITDARRIALLVDFVNARGDGWEVPWDGVPAARVRAVFQSTTQPEVYFGGGVEYFTSDVNGVSATRKATMDESIEFARLVGVPLAAFRSEKE